jgi:hypothetical protein
MSFDRDRFHRRRIYQRRQNEPELMTMIGNQPPSSLPLPADEVPIEQLVGTSLAELARVDEELRQQPAEQCGACLAPVGDCCCPAIEGQRIPNPPPDASWLDNRTVPIIRICAKCKWRGRPPVYDIGAGPEWTCPECEWCQGALGQDLTPYKPDVTLPESKAHE